MCPAARERHKAMNTQALWTSLATLVAVWLMMLAEAGLSAFNTRILRARGAVEPPDDAYRLMRWAYPASFALMAIEGAMTGPAPRAHIMAGLVIFGVAKALKLWAIASLGLRWSYRVLVLPGEPLVGSGPYRLMRHPNYVAVLGEIAGVAVMLGAIVTFFGALAGFGSLMIRRIRIEEAALGLREKPTPSRGT